MYMALNDMLAAVRNDWIKFVTMRPPDSQFALLERHIVVTDPPELVQLAQMGTLDALDALTKLLTDPGRAWAAEVLLAAMTRREEKIVDTYAAHPDEWWRVMGEGAYQRWSSWLKENRAKLAWDEANKTFTQI
jgi:hypothetical protein